MSLVNPSPSNHETFHIDKLKRVRREVCRFADSQFDLMMCIDYGICDVSSKIMTMFYRLLIPETCGIIILKEIGRFALPGDAGYKS